MKRILLLIYLFSCWYVDLDKDLIVQDSSGRPYANYQNFFHEKQVYFENPEGSESTYKTISIKWDRVVIIVSSLGYCTSLVLRKRKENKILKNSGEIIERKQSY